MNPPRPATRQQRRIARLLATAGLLAAFAFLTPAARASAASTAMAPDTVTQIADLGVTLAVPADGRLNGYQFAARILGAATGTAMPGPHGARAGSGQRLWVFGLRWSADQLLDSSGQFQGVAQITATFIYDQARLTVPVTQPPNPPDGTTGPVDSGAQYFLTSLPATAQDVQLELANGGFAQDFSLTHMTRQGARPDVLYRDPRTWQITQPLTLSKSLPTPYTAADNGALAGASMTLALDSVTLSYFAPDGPTDTPADPSKAWLIPDLEDPLPKFSSAFQNLNYTTHAAASGITLTMADGTVITAKEFPGGGPDPTTTGFDNNNVFVDRFAFQVPADITAATITVVLPPEVAYPDYGFTAPSQTYNLAPVKFAFTLPPAQPVTAPPGASNRPAAIRAVSATTASRNSSSPFALPIILVLLASVAVAGPLLLRRRAGRGARQVEPDLPPQAPTGASEATFETAGSSASAPVGDAPDAAAAAVGTATLTRPEPAPVHAQEETLEPTTSPEAEPAVGGMDLAGSDPLDGYVPPEAPNLGEAAVIIYGPVAGVVGWAERPDRNAVAEIVFYLATHPGRPVSTETLRAALGGEDADPDRQTLRSNISRARRALGDGHLPDAGTAGGYQLQDIGCDLTLIEQLSVRAASAERQGDHDEAINLYGQAVALIAGRPFEAGPGYSWIDHEDLRSNAERTATTAANNLARLALAADQPRLALWAARQGLRANPIEQALAAPAIAAAKRCGRNPALRAQWTSIIRTLQAHGIEPDPDLTAHYRRLLDEPDD